MKYKIGVILVNYNGIIDTLDCIDSLLKSSMNELLEIYVVDNSTVRNQSDEISETYSQVHVIRSEINDGFSNANNIGISEAIGNKCTHIMLLNNDTVVDKNMISVLLKSVDGNSIVAPTILYYEEPNCIWSQAGHISRLTGNAKNGKMGSELNNEAPEEIKCNFLSGCCMLMETSTFCKIGKLDESYFMYFEDADYCIRASKLGVSLKCITNAVLYHKVGKSVGGSKSPFCAYYLTRNRLNFIRKFKTYFNPISYLFSLCTRMLRMFQCDDLATKEAYQKAIRDHLKNIHGKTEYVGR